MAVPIILSFLVKMAAKVGIKKARQMATKKYGKEALKNITKSKPVKHKTELQRVKEQIARDLKKLAFCQIKSVYELRINLIEWQKKEKLLNLHIH